ncbi:MAG: 3D-(3,5/4)-trihydroxycyclohexane-1,2-dione acylhydrolase (decyclizing), partial [Zoogloeaceae bacterium]|jgi:3D-(3,5/4)-trihydroxycyclohexane-1,2-dione acylhydrolase (decyclizing)|nr:3D-(3,5/4)-trihydroxycyclohexane-1,2-dione acylhydrolase (decyclizing) [Zoogloeaceae bacterium]
METIRLTTAQALVRFLDQQYVSFDGEESKFVEGIFTIFGHGIAVGLGQALDEDPGALKVFQGRNEQGMCHAATAFAKQHRRRRIIACASSVGPGAANMVTACATATVNNLPLLVFPADTFASRQPDPVLQQLEQSMSLAVTTNDAFKPVCKYWDRITRPEQLMTALINALRVLTDPAETGAVCVALCQDVEGESYDYPDYFFQKRVHRIVRQAAAPEEIEDVAAAIASAKRPLLVVGGGVNYSEAGEVLEDFCAEFQIPFGETQAGKSACRSGHPLCLGGIGVTGTLAANTIAEDADLVLAVGTRLGDFATGSKSQFKNPAVRIASINNNRYHASKMDAVKAVGDARATLEKLAARLREKAYRSAYRNEIRDAKAAWDAEMQRLGSITYGDDFEPIIKNRDPRTLPEFVALHAGGITQTAAIRAVRESIGAEDVIVTAGGSLPSCLQRMWTTERRGGYHAEYGYSCMGYEVAAALGVKLAVPDCEVYAFVGDASFQMLHSEIMTAMQERVKINILLFDNCGFGCINNLQMNHGVGSLATEFRYRDAKGEIKGDLIPVDYAKVASGYGLKTYTARSISELQSAIADARRQSVSTLIDLKVIPKTMTDGYKTWWNVGVATTSEKPQVREAATRVLEMRGKARKY